MCGRFAIAASKEEMFAYLQEYFNIYEPEIQLQLPRYNIAPSEKIPCIVSSNKNYSLIHAKWGFIPWFAKRDQNYLFINAKAETISEKSSFREVFKKKRCLIPISGFYEWQQEKKQKIPHYITEKTLSLFLLAGIWDFIPGERELSCAIITTNANNDVFPIHHRMPVIISYNDVGSWFDNTSPKDLLKSYDNNKLMLTKVSTFVNKTGNDSIECIKQI